MNKKVYILLLISTMTYSLYYYHMNFNIDLLKSVSSLRLQDFTCIETLRVQTAGDSLSDDLYKFLELEQQESNHDIKFQFTNRGIRGARLQTYQHPTHTGVNITILWIGSNNIRSMDSHEVASRILDAMRSYEEQGMICFVIGMPARYGPRAGNNYLADSKAVNNRLEEHLRNSGKFISLPSEAYAREAYRSDQIHFTPEMYRTIAKLALSTMEEFIKTNSASLIHEERVPLVHHNSISYGDNFDGPKSDFMESKENSYTYDDTSKFNEKIVEIKTTQISGIAKSLKLSEVLRSSGVTWPVVVMGTGGRSGNCINTYAVTLALRQEFGANATFAIRRKAYDMVAQAMDIQRLTLPIVERRFERKAKQKKLVILPPQKFKIKKNLVAHIKPSIINEINNFKNTKQKKILVLYGYTNRMSLIAEYKDEILKSFLLKSYLLEKAQKFLHKVLEIHGSDLIFIGFHIRRGDYVNHSKSYNGVSVPGPQYYLDALEYYRHRFSNVVFVVASDDLRHAKSHLSHHPDVVFTDMKRPVEDMALLASCNHSIMTVGSFGWWSSYLAGGEVVYALLYNYTIPPFAHPEMMGDHGFENFHGIPVL